MPYLDWTGLVTKTIPQSKDLSILEFGLGEGTQFLIQNFRLVYSHELISDRKWYDYTVEKLGSAPNWHHELVLNQEVNFDRTNPNLPQWLLDRIDELFVTYNFDTVLIDGDYHVRGDIANYVLNKHYPSYVVIHDTNYAYELDGYHRIQLPPGYVTEKSIEGEGTIVFIKI